MKLLHRSLVAVFLISWLALVAHGQKIPDQPALQEAQTAYERGDFPSALATLDRILAKNPSNNAAYYLRGEIKLRNRDLDGAMSDLQNSLRLAPNIPGIEKVLNDIGMIHQFRVEDKEALVEYEKAIAKNPAYPPPHNGRAVVLENLGRPDEALKEYELYIKLEANPVAGYVGRSGIRFRRHDLAGALEDATKVVEGNEKFPSSFLHRGIILGVIGRFEPAVADIRKAFEMKNRPEYKFARLDIALADFNKYIAAYPTEADAYATRGLIYLFLHDDVAAESDMKRALSTKPELRTTVEELATYIRQIRK